MTIILVLLFLCSSLLEAEPIHLRPGSHLFVDDYLISYSEGLRRTTHSPRKLGQSIIPSAEPWHEMPLPYLKVIYYSASAQFRMWYNIRNNKKGIPSTAYAYAESEDGIKWRRPNLGMVEVQGTRDNNMFKAVERAFGLGFIDEGPAYLSPLRRFKMAYYRLTQPMGMHVAFSPDGLVFTEYSHNPVLTDVSDIVDAAWDPLKDEYLVCFKVWSIPSDGYEGSTPNAREGMRRLVVQSTSEDFIRWTPPYRIIVADPEEPGIWEFYGMVPQIRGQLYLGFLRVLRDDLDADLEEEARGIGWTELVTSRDGLFWMRHREPFLDRSTEAGTFDHAMAWVGDVVTDGERELVYYGGYSEGHKVGKRQISVAFLRKNGFVSRDVGSTPGLLRTAVVILEGDKMVVNARVEGELAMRIVGPSGKAVSGFDWSDFSTIRGDSVNHAANWRGDLSELRQNPVRLEFRLREAQLYGFELISE